MRPDLSIQCPLKSSKPLAASQRRPLTIALGLALSNELKMRLAIVFTTVALAQLPCTAGPTPTQMNELWLMTTAFSCVAQSPEYDQTSFAISYAKLPQFQGWKEFRATPRARCLAARQWLPKALCDEVLATISAENHGARLLDLLTQHHQDALESEPINRILIPSPIELRAEFVCPVDRPPYKQP